MGPMAFFAKFLMNEATLFENWLYYYYNKYYFIDCMGYLSRFRLGIQFKNDIGVMSIFRRLTAISTRGTGNHLFLIEAP